MVDTIKTLFSIKDGTVGGGLILLFFGALVTLVVKVWQDHRANRARQKIEEHELARAEREREQHLREVIIDVILHSEFDLESVRKITAPQRVGAMKDVIAATEDYRPFLAFEERDPTFEDYRGVRRQLDTPLMVACDRFFDLSQLFQAYYEKLASDEFVALSKARKYDALENLVEIGARVERAFDDVSEKMQASAISADIYRDVQAILPKNKTARNSPDGPSNTQ